MKQRNTILWLAVVALLIVGLIAYQRFNPVSSQPPHAAVPQSNAPLTPSAPIAVTTDADTNKVYQIRADRVLATVNGVALKLGDLIPLTTTNADAVKPLDAVTYEYMLDRAINRELIMQLAKAQGVGLTDAQQRQLGDLRAQREAPEPGLLAKLTVNEAAIALQLRDSEAFMLQTAMMAQRGFSPDVTQAQVDEYYKTHAEQFGQPPADADARKQWEWNRDIAIRNLLEKQVRIEYISTLKTFMEGQKAAAQITTENLN